MNKTLHKKLTERHIFYHTPALAYANDEELNSLVCEMGILREAAADLLQPRPQAVSRILQMAREM
jgi:hypothetical protein